MLASGVLKVRVMVTEELAELLLLFANNPNDSPLVSIVPGAGVPRLPSACFAVKTNVPAEPVEATLNGPKPGVLPPWPSYLPV